MAPASSSSKSAAVRRRHFKLQEHSEALEEQQAEGSAPPLPIEGLGALELSGQESQSSFTSAVTSASVATSPGRPRTEATPHACRPRSGGKQRPASASAATPASKRDAVLWSGREADFKALWVDALERLQSRDNTLEGWQRSQNAPVLSETEQEQLFAKLYARSNRTSPHSRAYAQALQHEAEEVTFQPKINKRSSEMIAEKRPKDPKLRLEIMYLQGKEKGRSLHNPSAAAAAAETERYDTALYSGEKWAPTGTADAYQHKMRKMREEMEAEGFPFQPEINQRSNRLVQAKRQPKSTIYARTERDLKNKQEKVDAIRREQAREETRECTFAPTIRNSVSMKVLMEAAAMRLKRERKAKRDTPSGNKWDTNLLTAENEVGYLLHRSGSAPRDNHDRAFRSGGNRHSLGPKSPHARAPGSTRFYADSGRSSRGSSVASGHILVEDSLTVSLLDYFSTVAGTPQSSSPAKSPSTAPHDNSSYIDRGRPISSWEAKHCERLRKGRERQAEIHKVLHMYDGSNWQNKPTEPKEFNFNHSGYLNDIKSLKQPVAWKALA